MPYENRTNAVCNWKRQATPRVNGELQLGIVTVQPGDLFVLWGPIGPVKGNLLGTPLHFVLVNARSLGGAAEIEHRVATLGRKGKRVPVQENVGFQGKIFSNGSSPRGFDRVTKAEQETASDGRFLQSNDRNEGFVWKTRQNALEEPSLIDRCSKVALFCTSQPTLRVCCATSIQKSALPFAKPKNPASP